MPERITRLRPFCDEKRHCNTPYRPGLQLWLELGLGVKTIYGHLQCICIFYGSPLAAAKASASLLGVRAKLKSV